MRDFCCRIRIDCKLFFWKGKRSIPILSRYFAPMSKRIGAYAARSYIVMDQRHAILVSNQFHPKALLISFHTGVFFLSMVRPNRAGAWWLLSGYNTIQCMIKSDTETSSTESMAPRRAIKTFDYRLVSVYVKAKVTKKEEVSRLLVRSLRLRNTWKGILWCPKTGVPTFEIRNATF